MTTVTNFAHHWSAFVMSLILLEALAALVLLLGIVWWTMFSGRRGGELEEVPAAAPSVPEIGPGPSPAPASASAIKSEPPSPY